MEGIGFVNATLNHLGGTINPGGVNIIGSLRISIYIQSVTAVLNIEAVGVSIGQYDTLIVLGTCNIAGRLVFITLLGHQPTSGSIYYGVIIAGSWSSTFSLEYSTSVTLNHTVNPTTLDVYVVSTNPQSICSSCVHGDCIDASVCSCHEGWTDSDCSTPSCPLGCVNGQCNGPNECTCDSDFVGIACDVPKPETGIWNGTGCSNSSCVNFHPTADTEDGSCACKSFLF